jgi:N2,N2-dimethylguanosine tRNA methyltransferase
MALDGRTEQQMDGQHCKPGCQDPLCSTIPGCTHALTCSHYDSKDDTLSPIGSSDASDSDSPGFWLCGAVLCGNNGEACWAKYGSYPLHRPYCHEMALRILLACIAGHAARHKRYIVPIVSLSIDFYVRVFVRVFTSAAEVKNTAARLAYVYQSQGCDSFFLQRVARKVWVCFTV